MTERVRTTIDDGIATVVLNRPEKLNALDPAMFTGLVESGRRLARDRSVRAVVLRGAGDAFSAGLDVKAARKKGPEMVARLFLKPWWTRDNLAQRVSLVWRDLPVPVVAAIHGHCYGGGLQIALGADFRFVAPDAQLSVMEVKLGIIPDMGISVSLRELVRADVARDLAMTGRKVSGVEAVELGLATWVADDPYAAAVAYAAELASRPAPAIRGIMRLFRDTWASPPDDGLRTERALQMRVLARRLLDSATGRG
jgi:enoyl-CoA hydratase/carnithine racemase